MIAKTLGIRIPMVLARGPLLILGGLSKRRYVSQDVNHVNSKGRSDVPDNSSRALETISTTKLTTSAGLDKVY